MSSAAYFTPSSGLYYLEIVQAALFVVLLPFALFNAYKHRSTQLSGWFFVIAFSLAQLSGAALNIDAGKGNVSETGSIIQSVGTSTLIVANYSLLHACVENTSLEKAAPFHWIATILFHGTLILGAGITTLGSVKVYDAISDGENPSSTDRDLTKAGVCIFALGWLWTFGLSLLSLTTRAQMQNKGKLLYAIVASMPLIAIRVAYTLLSFFDTSTSTFNAFSGSAVARALMNVLPGFAAGLVMCAGGILMLFGKKYQRTPDAEVQLLQYQVQTQYDGFKAQYEP